MKEPKLISLFDLCYIVVAVNRTDSISGSKKKHHIERSLFQPFPSQDRILHKPLVVLYVIFRSIC